MKKPIEINGVKFKTLGDAIDYCRTIADFWYDQRKAVNRGRFTNIEVPLVGADLDFMRQVLKLHPDFKAKKKEAQSRGAIGICVAPSDHGSRCFYIMTKVKPMVQFSFSKCIKHGGTHVHK